ncbi:hypothetical protein [Georgenia ruanii]|uniref:hypothetical protein n=1 Tax=Georgenia ruanii TaxID=348442 RepID=UPI0012648492|nr:hypothetical protein [Georgenia ruanii]
MATIVSAPADLLVATSDGIDVRFAGIVLRARFPSRPGYPRGGTGLGVRLAGVRGPETQRRDNLFLDAREMWAERLKTEGPDAAAGPPTMPGVPVLERVQATVSDDIDTAYRLIAGRVAGDGTEWDAAWIYAPAPPDTAGRLTLQFTLDGAPTGKECEIRLH